MAGEAAHRAVDDRSLRRDPGMRTRVSAYPGTLTYLDLIRRNRFESAVLMAVMVVLGVVIGAVAAAGLGAYGGAGAEELWISAALGGFVALVLASAGAAWSWYGGAGAILRMSGARPVSREDDPELFNVVDEMCIAAGLPMPRIYIIEDSAMNAFATGRDPEHGAVAVTRGLRERLTRDELQGVIAHEMAHIRHLDIRFSMVMATMVGLIVFACDAFFRVAWHGGHGAHRASREAKAGGAPAVVLLVIAVLLAIVAPLFAKIIQMAWSRRREYLADAGAVELTRNPLGLASALQKLADDEDPFVDTANRGLAHMYMVNPLRKMRRSHQSLDSLFLSHPPIQERIARLLALTR